ncbi:TIGR02647 family protein [Catenovulum sp. SM1970]|uniref:TIGR02647 family protein n=1 Tax=Marinifaba aquimaris TaxID=2741323 RepID=UPI001572B5AE|nr:TIGR02647 family protein [Marinifaba aquimaris]NTS75542.1 TIGR02647 family protein [Marinifaba aquimaris]
MPINTETNEELKILVLYTLASVHEGLKVHSDAGDEKVAAAKRLYDKGLVTQPDGGYLTNLGREAAEHAHKLMGILQSV